MPHHDNLPATGYALNNADLVRALNCVNWIGLDWMGLDWNIKCVWAVATLIWTYFDTNQSNRNRPPASPAPRPRSTMH